MTQTFETSPINAHNDTAPKTQEFMIEAQSWSASFNSMAPNSPEVDIEFFKDGSFTISQEGSVLTTDDPRGYERTPTLNTATPRHLGLVTLQDTLLPQLRRAS